MSQTLLSHLKNRAYVMFYTVTQCKTEQHNSKYVLAHSMLVSPTLPETCWKIVPIYGFLLVDYSQTFPSDIEAAVTSTVHRNKYCIMHLRYTDTKYIWKYDKLEDYEVNLYHGESFSLIWWKLATLFWQRWESFQYLPGKSN